MEAAVLQSGEEGGAGLLMDSGEEETPVRIIPLPLEPVSGSCSTTEQVNGHVSRLDRTKSCAAVVISAASLSVSSVCLVTMETSVGLDHMDLTSACFRCA